jgi:hypothetical protein
MTNRIEYPLDDRRWPCQAATVYGMAHNGDFWHRVAEEATEAEAEAHAERIRLAGELVWGKGLDGEDEAGIVVVRAVVVPNRTGRQVRRPRCLDRGEMLTLQRDDQAGR